MPLTAENKTMVRNGVIQYLMSAGVDKVTAEDNADLFLIRNDAALSIDPVSGKGWFMDPATNATSSIPDALSKLGIAPKGNSDSVQIFQTDPSQLGSARDGDTRPTCTAEQMRAWLLVGEVNASKYRVVG